MKNMIWLSLPLLIFAGLLGFIYYQTVPPPRSELISTDYFNLRQRFIAAAQKANARLIALPIAAKGPKGEPLSTDIAWFGSEHPKQVFLHISGTHGVEGYAGSAIQTAILDKGVPALPEDKALIFIHALNPWGMAHKRRFNESNVDINRNFLDSPTAFRGAPESYRLIEQFLNPPGAPSRIDSFYPGALFNVLRYGFVSLKQAIAGGQYEYERGIYFGGKKLEESSLILKDFFLKSLASVERLYVVEVHSGLGDWAKDVLFWPLSLKDPKTVWFSEQLGETLASDAPDEGVGFRTPGDLQNEVPKLIPHTEVYWLLQEFGAYGPVRTLRALRDENRYYQSGGNDMNHWSKEMLVEIFNPGASDWQAEVLRRGLVLYNEYMKVLLQR